MFTGIIQAVATVSALSEGRLEISSPQGAWPDPIVAGESVAVNGVCLTAIGDGALIFDLSPETLRRTSLGTAVPGARVNLERAMGMTSRFGGHIVQGHVDGTAVIVGIRREGNSVVYRFSTEGDGRYLVDKGSVTLDGVSLTVVDPRNGEFEVWTIPHTIGATNLGDRAVGDRVNLEYDEIAKWVERLAGPYART